MVSMDACAGGHGWPGSGCPDCRAERESEKQQHIPDDAAQASRIGLSLGKRQRAVILALSESWGKSPSHECAKRMWNGPHYLIDHKHGSGNCWRLNRRGLCVQHALQDALVWGAI